MKYGICLPNFGPYSDARTLVDLARDAEQAGWDGFFMWDHIVPDHWWPQNMVDTWIALAAVAMNTHTIRIGPMITPLPRRRPWKVARETVSLDRLSGGRVILGVGIGVGPQEWDRLGEETDLKARGAMLDESLAILTGLWSGETVNYNGTYYQVKDTSFQPTPIQQPRIPIWVGGFWPNKAPFRRAARWDGACPIFPGVIENVPTLIREVADFVHARRENDDPFEIVYTGRTPSDPVQAAAVVKPFAEAGLTWWLEDIEPANFWDNWDGQWPEEALRERIRQGPPAL